MTYITTAERFGRQYGEREGRLEGTLDSLSALLEARFGAAGVDLLPELRAIGDVAILRAVLVCAATATTLDEVRAAYRDRAQAHRSDAQAVP